MALNLTGCGVISACSIDFSGAATSPSTAGVGYGMFGYSGVGLGIAAGASGPGQGMAFFTCGDFERMRIVSSGNVGIGTTNPSYKLQVVNSGAVGMSIVTAGSTSGSPSLQLLSDSTDSTISSTSNGLELTAYSSHALLLKTANVERMRITNTGNVGIGTTSPNISGFTGTMLTLNGTGNYQGLEISTCGGARMTMLADISGTLGYISTRQAGMSLVFETGAASEKMRINCSGNVGINCSAPGSKLTVGGTLTTTDTITTTSGTVNTIISWNSVVGIVGTDTNHGLQIRTCGTERIRITCNGEIGINTSSPGSYKLYVNGSFYSAGSSCEYKTSICQYNTDSCMFMKLKPVTYQYKDEWCHLGKELKSGTQIGLIAEDTAEVFPELAILKDEDEQKVVRNVDYEKLSIVLLSEVQKLRQEVDQLKNK